jgi:hypothetical protein
LDNFTPISESGHEVGRDKKVTFIKRVYGWPHFPNDPPAIAIHTSSLEQGEADGGIILEVIDKESCQSFTAPISLIRNKGILLESIFGDQIALPFELWKQNGCQPQMDYLP